MMRVTCPECLHDITLMTEGMGTGDGEDYANESCPGCKADLEIEIVVKVTVLDSEDDDA